MLSPLVTPNCNPRRAELPRKQPNLVCLSAELTAAVRLPQSAHLVFVGRFTILTKRVLRNGEIPPETVLGIIWESPNTKCWRGCRPTPVVQEEGETFVRARGVQISSSVVKDSVLLMSTPCFCHREMTRLFSADLLREQLTNGHQCLT